MDIQVPFTPKVGRRSLPPGSRLGVSWWSQPLFCSFLFLILFKYSWFTGFPAGSVGKESTCKAGDLGLTPGSGRSSGEGHGNPLQYSCLENLHGQRGLAGYSPWDHQRVRHSWVTQHACTHRVDSQVVSVSRVQHRGSVLHIQLSILCCRFSSQIDYYKILSRVPCSI